MRMFADIARTRRSCRLFSGEPLSEDEIDTLLETGALAPTSRNLRPVRLVPVRDADVIRRLSGCKDSGAKALETAPFAIVVAADPAVDTWIEDSSIASIFLQMQAEDMGIGSCWIQVRMRSRGETPAEDLVREAAGIDGSLRILSIIAFGRKS